MSRWFRMYDCVLDDPKVQRLPGDLFKTWVNLLCVASRNDGQLPNAADLAFMLRMSDDAISTALRRLVDVGLIDDGEKLSPHNWDQRQFKSDVSTERVKRFRKQETKRASAVSVTPPDTDTDTDTEKTEEAIASSADEAKISPMEIKRRLEQATGWPDLPGIGAIEPLISEGHSFEDRILPLAKDEAARRSDAPKSWTYLAAVVRDQTRKPTAAAKPVEVAWVPTSSPVWKRLCAVKPESLLRQMVKPGPGGDGLYWPVADLPPRTEAAA
jgi:hypothetical protein